VEEYLETVLQLEEEGIAVIQARLAERIGHSPPSVSEMVKRLNADGFLHVEGRALHLTAKGRGLAESVVRKHRLAERLLADVIGLEWHKIHNEAGRWEHVISDEVEAKLVALLGNPATCPHGNPIPGGAPLPPMDLRPLAEISPGTAVRLERVTEQVELDYEALSYLHAHRFTPGATATVRSKGPDGTLTVGVGEDFVLSLGPQLASCLLVTLA
jgi:DtxR family Mn-dependent transcriptional regulator